MVEFVVNRRNLMLFNQSKELTQSFSRRKVLMLDAKGKASDLRFEILDDNDGGLLRFAVQHAPAVVLSFYADIGESFLGIFVFYW
ncbi:hypothetical protein QT970_28505 [Microcoleus sp. herbarium8]|uniref:hypothetical protein n=1 Tax=Microcoleus sp. herbarium8 TaxID=3055436 RepID=UPI002FD42409